MPNWKLLRELPLAIQGVLADEATTREAARLLDDDHDVEEFLSAWLAPESHAAFRIDNQMAWTFRALEKPVLVHWTFTSPDDSETRNMKVYAYEDEKDAYQDACRLTLQWVLDSKTIEVRHLTGWQKDVVMLVRGADFYSIRTHYTGEIKIEGSEEIQLAYKYFVELATDLSAEIEFKGDMPGLRENSLYGKIASAFVQREAAQALQAYARHVLSLGLDGAASIEKLGGLKINMSQLARSLHTDRPNLTRYLGKSSMADMTPEKIRAAFGENND
jgi:hypothetical protein